MASIFDSLASLPSQLYGLFGSSAPAAQASAGQQLAAVRDNYQPDENDDPVAYAQWRAAQGTPAVAAAAPQPSTNGILGPIAGAAGAVSHMAGGAPTSILAGLLPQPGNQGTAPGQQPGGQRNVIGDVLDELTGGYVHAARMRQLQDNQIRVQLGQAALQRQAVADAIQQHAGDPETQALIRLNPKAYFDAQAENLKNKDLAEKHSLVGPGGKILVTAPALVDHEGVYGTQTVDGYTPTGQAAASTQEVNTADNNAAVAAQAAANAAELARNHRATEANAAAGTAVERGKLAEQTRRDNLEFPSWAAPVNGTPGAAGAVSGEAYLNTLPPNIAGEVKAISEGRMAVPSGMALRSPQIQQLLAAVAQFDPTFDAANPQSRAATRKDFTSGSSARNITSLNTAIGHMGDLAEAVDGLHNGPIPLLNGAGNWIAQNTGDPKMATFNTAKEAVATELTRVFRGSGGSESDVQAWLKTLDGAQSPAQLRAAIKQGASLLGSRLDALNQQYTQGMGRSADPMAFLTPKKAAIYSALSANGSVANTQHAPAPPDVGQRTQGQVYQTPKGAMQWTGTGWLPAN